MGAVRIRSSAMGLTFFLLCSLCTYTLANEQDLNFGDELLFEGRQFAIQNVSLVITYTSMVVAVVMMASFLWIAMNFGTGRSGYSGYGEDDYYSRRKRSSGTLDDPDVLSNLLGSWHQYHKEEEEELDHIVGGVTSAKKSSLSMECAYKDACTAGQSKNSENLRTLSLVLRLLRKAPNNIADMPTLANIMRAYVHGQKDGNCEKYKTETSCW